MIEQLCFALIVAGLVYGNLDYQVSRLAYFLRLRDHRPALAASLARFREAGPPPLTILVPSYKEELRVIEQTVREKLPETFQRSEFLLEHGALDMIVDRRQLADRISSLCTMMMGRSAP